MKTNSAFKFKKSYKRVAATIIDKHKQGEYIRSMIEAQVHEQIAMNAPLKKSKDKE